MQTRLPLPEDQTDHVRWFVTSTVLGVAEQSMLRAKAELHGRLARAGDGGLQLLSELQDLERELIALRTRRHNAELG